ncbi:hypothetical protein K378_01415 [Streptomyces sp. Amel2xB2]|uniref:hypothetical protein n=1 Tax=Streptomyces sp. Amel2xB2 TaxID=1305829 RepID=UPI000DB9633D|nr:hypothetical protein [Streptomyces sp. Amel2xB2]RAJ70250.1 hypothetical protein K378_01415 [Streptomyces sp. Amel2xB2]
MRTYYVWSIEIVLPGEGVFEAASTLAAPVPISEAGMRQAVVEGIADKQHCKPTSLVVVRFTYTELPALTAPEGA